MPWSLPFLVEELAAALRAHQDALHLEQAVRGLDHEDEVAIQARLADALARRYEVKREQHYPGCLDLPKRSQRLRCDLVLAERGSADHEALWLEVKVAHQRREGGRHNPRYSQQWRGAIVTDLRKLKADPQIHHAALCFVVFTDDEDTFTRDVATFERLLADEELLAGWRSTAGFAIDDRIGHRRCSVAIWPLV